MWKPKQRITKGIGCRRCLHNAPDIEEALSWAAQYNTWLLIKLTPNGVVFDFFWFSRQLKKHFLSFFEEAPKTFFYFPRKLFVMVQVIGLVGSSRKRTLMLWQAVELSRMMQRPDLATLQIARKALEPPDDPLEQVCHP